MRFEKLANVSAATVEIWLKRRSRLVSLERPVNVPAEMRLSRLLRRNGAVRLESPANASTAMLTI